MTENKPGILGVVRTLDREYVLLPVPAEDEEKKKQERVVPEKTWRVIRSGMLGSISEGVKPEDVDVNNELGSFANALSRASLKEFGFHIDRGQILWPAQPLGMVEQTQNDQEVSFDVWFCNLLLYQSHLARVPQRIVLPKEEMVAYLKENEQNIRPSTVAAMRKTLEQEGAKL